MQQSDIAAVVDRPGQGGVGGEGWPLSGILRFMCVVWWMVGGFFSVGCWLSVGFR